MSPPKELRQRTKAFALLVIRLGVVVEEADELELLDDSAVVRHERLQGLEAEARELTALFTAAQHTSRNPQIEQQV